MGPRGVQIPLTMELKDNGRWRPRVLDELCRSIFPSSRANFGGSPRAKEYIVNPDLVDTRVGAIGEDAASRSDPTFTRASPG